MKFSSFGRMYTTVLSNCYQDIINWHNCIGSQAIHSGVFESLGIRDTWKLCFTLENLSVSPPLQSNFCVVPLYPDSFLCSPPPIFSLGYRDSRNSIPICYLTNELWFSEVHTLKILWVSKVLLDSKIGENHLNYFSTLKQNDKIFIFFHSSN